MEKSGKAELKRGMRLLKELLPAARAEARNLTAQDTSPLGATTLSHLTEDKLEAVRIYEAPLGGWHCDVTFRNMPPGVPTAIGTPVERPLRTRAEAEEFAKGLLASMMAAIIRNKEQAVAPQAPVFLLCGWALPLRPELYAVAAQFIPDELARYDSPWHAAARIEALLAELAPGGFDAHAFETWSRFDQSRLVAVLHVAALSGLYAYPMREDASPSGHTQTSTAAH